MNKKYILSLLVVLTTVALFMISLTTINTKEVVGVKNNFLNTNTAQTHIPPVNRKVVNIPDANFKKIILDLLREDEKSKTVDDMDKYKLYIKPESETEVYEDEMELIKIIFFNDKNITDITGIEKGINIKTLALDSNNISNIEPLKNLINIENLRIMGNKVTNLDSLYNMKKLVYLEAQGNEITDISGLKGTTSLKSAMLNNNKIKDITPLSNLKDLGFLLLEENEIEDVSPLSNLSRINVLQLNNNKIKDVKFLENIKIDKDSFLKLNNNSISDLRIPNSGTYRYLTLNNQTITINPEENKFELGLYLNDGTKLDVEAEGLIDNNDGTYSLKDPNIGINFKYKDIFDVTINPIEENEVVKVEEENKEVEVTTNTNDNTNNTSDINKTTTNKDGSLSSSKLPYAGTTTNILLVISIILVIIYSNKVLRKQKLINSLSKVVDKGIRK